jgi:acyl carrier protein
VRSGDLWLKIDRWMSDWRLLAERGAGVVLVNAIIRDVLRKFGRLPVDVMSLSDEADLYSAGMTSFAAVEVMLALEEAFNSEFPDSMLNRRTFESIATMEAALRSLNSEAAA